MRAIRSRGQHVCSPTPQCIASTDMLGLHMDPRTMTDNDGTRISVLRSGCSSVFPVNSVVKVHCRLGLAWCRGAPRQPLEAPPTGCLRLLPLRPAIALVAWGCTAQSRRPSTASYGMHKPTAIALSAVRTAARHAQEEDRFSGHVALQQSAGVSRAGSTWLQRCSHSAQRRPRRRNHPC